MATGAVTNGDVYEPEAEAEVPEQKPAFDTLYISEHKVKYNNNYYDKVNAYMYDYKCDVKLTVGKSNFKGHRKVLADASDYFAAMFSHEMKEKDETVINLKDISPDGFSAMLDYFYHGHVTVEAKIIPDILEAGRFFHVDWILDICCDYMIRHLSILDYPLTMHLADKFSLGELRWEIFKYFGANLPSLVEKENFMKECSVDLLMQFLMECLYVDVSEYFLMQVILSWVKTDEDGRKEHLLPLLRQLRFHTMDLDELEEIPKEVTDIPEMRDEVEDAKVSCLTIYQQCLKNEEKYLIRGSKYCIMLSTFNDETERNVVVYKDPDNDEANLFVEQLGRTDIQSDYSSMAQATIGNFLFAAGGYDVQGEYSSSARVYMYDPRVREWNEVSSMQHPRVNFAFCSSDKKLYAIGGVFHKIGDIETGEVIYPSAEAYDPEENSWKSLPNLPYGTFDQAAAHSNNTLYVSGGISELPNHEIPIKSMFALEDGANEWTELPDMTVGRQGHSMTACGGKLYILGGFVAKQNEHGFNNCYLNDMFDIETKQWTKLTSTPESFGRLYRNVGLFENKIYFLCNNEDDVSLACFDIEKQEFIQNVIVMDELLKVCILQVAYQDS
ncbi:Kelch-like protein 5 [Mactra antiquata]